VPVSLGGRPFLDRGIGGDWVRPGVALVGVVKCDGDKGLVARNNDVWNPVVGIRSEVGMEPGVQTNAGQQVVGVRVDRTVGDNLVPGVVVGKGTDAAEVGTDT
jgi:hypothetical protein